MRHFKAHELVHPKIYEMYGEGSINFLHPKLRTTIDDIRDYFNTKMTINNYYWGGNLKNRGLRPYLIDKYAKYSQHKLGMAVDFDIAGMTADEVRQVILDDKDCEAFRHINRMELGVSWVHIDLKETASRIYTFNP